MDNFEKDGLRELAAKSGDFDEKVKVELDELFGVAGLMRNHKTRTAIEAVQRRCQNQLLRASAVAADLFDRQGKYDDSRDCLTDWEFVDRELACFSQKNTHRDMHRVMALSWYALMYSVKEHREGRHSNAQRISGRINVLVDIVIDQLRRRCHFQLVPVWLLLRGRIRYALGRHQQSQGNDKDAEKSLGEALEAFSEALEYPAGSPETKDRSVISRTATYWTAQIVVALGRSSIAQGHLQTGYRQVMVARTLLSQIDDQVGLAFSDYLIASVLRQRLDLDSKRRAINLLLSAVEKFEEIRHERYFHRGRYELAKCYLAVGDLTEAEQTMKRRLETKALYRGDERTQRRWSGSSLLLQARICLDGGDVENAMMRANEALEEFGENSYDLKAQAWAVLGEALLQRRLLDEAIKSAWNGLDLKPADPNDRAWLRLVLCRAYCERGHVDSAQRVFKELNEDASNIENGTVKSLYEEVKKRLDQEKGSFYIRYDESEKLSYPELSLKLRGFLVRNVRQRMRNRSQEEQAEALGIKKQTLANWVTELRAANQLDE
ncbi:MAG: hypothetical protein IPM24_09525 [Bryobacterales bacterium]|nr:hypothetical protein [Bryobacterales bacterium]